MAEQGSGPEPSDDGRPEANGGDAAWRAMLTGDASFDRQLRWQRRLFKPLPSNPRCKLCYAPQGAPFGPVMELAGFGKWEKTPTLCNACVRTSSTSRSAARTTRVRSRSVST